MSFSPYLRIGEFILGCLIAQLYTLLQDTRPSAQEQVVGRALLALGIISVPVIIYLMYGGHWTFFRNLNYHFGLAPSVALILFCSARYDTCFSRLLNTRPFVALGEASYSIYLTHFLIFILSASFLGGLQPTIPNAVFLTAKLLFLLALIMLIPLGLHAYLTAGAAVAAQIVVTETQATTACRRLLNFGSPIVIAVLFWISVPNKVIDPGLAVTSGIRVLGATYGANCGAKRGNVTSSLGRACDGKDNCHYVVDVTKLGDPAGGCAKDFHIDMNACRITGASPRVCQANPVWEASLTFHARR